MRCKQPTTARTAERYLGRLQIVAVGNEVANAVSLEQREALLLPRTSSARGLTGDPQRLRRAVVDE